MTDIPREICDFFFFVNRISDCLLLAYYKYDNNYIFIYEKDNSPNILCCNANKECKKSVKISYTLPDSMARLSKLEKENNELKKHIEKLETTASFTV